MSTAQDTSLQLHQKRVQTPHSCCTGPCFKPKASQMISHLQHFESFQQLCIVGSSRCIPSRVAAHCS
jgi:hypothetical protein